MDKTAFVLSTLPEGPLRDAFLDPGRRGWTPLMQAVVDGDEHAIARGGEVDAIAEGAVSALSLACVAGAERAVEILLAAGADPTMRTLRGTVLHEAAFRGFESIVRRLVAQGAKIASENGITPLGVAMGHAGVLEFLLTQPLHHSEPNAAFARACEGGHVEAMKRLLDHGAQATSEALMCAARGGDPRAVTFLIDHGAPVNEFDLKEELSPLMHAVTHGRIEAAGVLLDRGANPNAMTEWFVTALGIAERRGDGPMIALLRSRGATEGRGDAIHVVTPYATYSSGVPVKRPSPYETDDVLALAELGWTDIEQPATLGAVHCVALLLASGVAPNLAAAIRSNNVRVVRMMIAAGANATDPAMTSHAVNVSDPWILEALLARGAPANAHWYGTRAIDMAALSGGRAQLALLLAHGAQFDEDLNGASPMSRAAYVGQVRCVELLIEHELATGGLQIIRTPGEYRPHLKGIRRIDMALRDASDPGVIALLQRHGAKPTA